MTTPRLSEERFTEIRVADGETPNYLLNTARIHRRELLAELDATRADLAEERDRRRIDDERVEELIQKLHAAEAQRDALLEAMRKVPCKDPGCYIDACHVARGAIAAVEGKESP